MEPNRFRICQGDIFRNVYFYERIKEISQDELEIVKIMFPYIVVLSQDCDLNSDYFKFVKDERNLLSVIVAPIYRAENIFEGNIGNIGLNITNIRMAFSKRYENVKKFVEGVNKSEFERYHCIYIEDIPYIIDFKHHFSVSISELMEKKRNNSDRQYIYSIPTLEREKLTQRFSNYLSRIGLPPKKGELESLEKANELYQSKYIEVRQEEGEKKIELRREYESKMSDTQGYTAVTESK